jgi:hypothetical protein
MISVSRSPDLDSVRLGRARLEEAMAAFRLALKERTRERVPPQVGDDADEPRYCAHRPWIARGWDGASR